MSLVRDCSCRTCLCCWSSSSLRCCCRRNGLGSRALSCSCRSCCTRWYPCDGGARKACLPRSDLPSHLLSSSICVPAGDTDLYLTAQHALAEQRILGLRSPLV